MALDANKKSELDAKMAELMKQNMETARQLARELGENRTTMAFADYAKVAEAVERLCLANGHLIAAARSVHDF